MITQKQIHYLLEALQNEKNNLIGEISKVNTVLQKKNSNLNKVENYHTEYFIAHPRSKSFSIPALCQNYEKFLRKIESIIKSERDSIAIYEKSQKHLFSELDKINKRINGLKVLLDRILALHQQRCQINEESEFSDLVTLRIVGEQND